MSNTKKAINDKIKHRIIGTAVLIALFALISPIFISNNNFIADERIVNFTPPAPPMAPEVVIPKHIHAFAPVEVAELPEAIHTVSEQTETVPVELTSELPRLQEPSFIPG